MAWAGLDAGRKVVSGKLAALPVVVWLTLGQAPFFVAWQLTQSHAVSDWSAYAGPAMAVVGLNVAANILFVKSVMISPLSVTVPLLALTPAFAAIVAVPMLGEVPSLQQQAGIMVVVLGALLLNAGGSGGHPVQMLRSLFRERGSVYMGAVALLWSLTGPVDKIGLRYASVPIHGLVQTGGVGLVVLLLLLSRGRVRELADVHRARLPMAACVLFALFALGLQMFAYQMTQVALVETIKRSIGMISGVVLGRLIFHEKVDRFKISAVVLMSVGTALLAFG